MKVRAPRLVQWVLMLSLALPALGACAEQPSKPIKIGVLMTLSGEDDPGYLDVLEWVRKNINDGGGIAGRRLEFVYVDTAELDATGLQAAAQALADDDSIKGVIGPEWSSSTFELAPIFEAAPKPMVSPEATSDEISRAFQGSKYVWRTAEPDIAQVKMLLLAAHNRDASSISLVTSTDAYGETFFSWVPFFAVEIGIEIKHIVRAELSACGCAEATREALEGNPSVLIGVPSVVQDSVCIARTVKLHDAEQGTHTAILFADGGRFEGMIDALGEDAEGIEGTSPAPDPSTGFVTAFQGISGRPAPAFAANIYDAALLLAYGLERSGGRGGGDLGTAMRQVVSRQRADGTSAPGEPTGWDKYGIAAALAALRRGEAPDISGASGPLRYDPKLWVDPIETTYAHWRVEGGRFVDTAYYSTQQDYGGIKPSGEAAWRSAASDSKQSNLSNLQGWEPDPPREKGGLWALIVAGSRTSKNYRHQADALAQYQLLRSNSVDDASIILILADDLVDPNDGEPDVVRNEVEGDNLYENVEIDYRLGELDTGMVLDILEGNDATYLQGRDVIRSGPNDYVYVFWSGHGDDEGLVLDGRVPEERLTPATLVASLTRMRAADRFYRMLIVLEACHSGVMCTGLETDGVLMMTGASAFENSLGTNYDPQSGIWLADQFAYTFTREVQASPERSIIEMYPLVYQSVFGSHVTLCNANNFGDTNVITAGDFTFPD